ncbi:DUF5906 domain-containing protein [Mannheimia sp. AT1]|uniref:DUF5906 domain-containing protein n=1 Tax=Mannheimia cairinae TaxID=3025936 RepID=A0ABT5MPF0_9PAST|nr:DUF5906 domain-containing protein [Mannheimia cairinae]MDD0825193.1 DUF5906 domain-containing protein [Mannheimia cairinae]
MSKQPKGKPYEAYIIAGSTAWNKTKQQTILEWTKAEANYQPIILGDTQLKDIDRLKLAVDVGTVSIYRAGELTESDKNAICQNLAKHSTVETVAFYDEALQFEENASNYISRLRSELKSEHKPLEIPEAPTQLELIQLFKQWFNKPLKCDYDTQMIYAFNGVYWEAIGTHHLKRRLADFLDEYEQNYTADKISRIIALLEIKLDELPRANPHITGFTNTALNKLTGELLPLNIDLHLRGIEPFELSIATDTPYFDDWLSFVTENDESKREAILAGLYMILTNRHQWATFIEATGVGGAGKSVMGMIATLLNGKANTAFITLNEMEDEKHRATLIGKSLAYSSDQEPYRGSAEDLKRLTGGDIIRVRHLYEAPQDVKINACFLMLTNHAMSFNDRSGAIQRRRVIIPFTRKIPLEKKDVYFIEKVQKEIYGIVHKLLERFPNPEEARLILEAYKENSDSLAIKANGNHLVEFAQAFEITPAKGLPWGSTRSPLATDKAIYNAYLYFTGCQNLKPKDILPLGAFREAFKSALKEIGTGELTERILDGTRYTNVILKHSITNWT